MFNEKKINVKIKFYYSYLKFFIFFIFLLDDMIHKKLKCSKIHFDYESIFNRSSWTQESYSSTTIFFIESSPCVRSWVSLKNFTFIKIILFFNAIWKKNKGFGFCSIQLKFKNSNCIILLKQKWQKKNYILHDIMKFTNVDPKI